jgi:hypothetical protein
LPYSTKFDNFFGGKCENAINFHFKTLIFLVIYYIGQLKCLGVCKQLWPHSPEQLSEGLISSNCWDSTITCYELINKYDCPNLVSAFAASQTLP